MNLSERIRTELRKIAEEDCSCGTEGTQLNAIPTSMAGKDKLKELDNGKISDPKALKTEEYTFRGDSVEPKKKDFKTPEDVNEKTAACRNTALRIMLWVLR